MRIEPGGAHSAWEVTAAVIDQLLTYVTNAELLLFAHAILGTRDSVVRKGSTVRLLQILHSRVKCKPL